MLLVSQLIETGTVRLDADAALSNLNWNAETDRLTAWERESAVDFPGEPPAISQRVLDWSVWQFFTGCQIVAGIDVAAGGVKEALKTACPLADRTEAVYTVDLLFRFLPDLVRIAEHRSASNDVTGWLRQRCCEWPLSSVGVPDLMFSDDALAGWTNHPGLLTLYADRVIEKQDESRLESDSLRNAIAVALGDTPERFTHMSDAFRAIAEMPRF